MISRWVVGVVLLFGILLLMLPSSDEQSLDRIASTSMLACTKALRAQIASQLIDDSPVSVAFDNNCPELIASLEVDAQGGIVIIGNHHKLTMWLTPVMEGEMIRWSCRGEPAQRITRLCKP